MTKVAKENKNLQPLSEISKLIASIVADDLGSVLSETLERVFTPAARLEELNRKDYLTEKEVAELFPISAATLRTHRSRGVGPKFIKDRASILYRRRDIDEYYSRRTINTRG